MIVELDDYEDEFIKIQDLLLSLHCCTEHLRCVNNDAYYLETLVRLIIAEYDRLVDNFHF